MAIQFPDDLLITNCLSIQIVQTAPVDQGRALSRKWFELPIDRIAKLQPRITKQIKLSAEDSLCVSDRLSFSLGPSRTKSGNRAFSVLKTQKECRLRARA